MQTAWRDEGPTPSSYSDVGEVRRIGSAARDLLVDFTWDFTRREIRMVRHTAYLMNSGSDHWVARFYKFNAQVIAAVNEVMPDRNRIFRKINLPKGSDRFDSAVSVEKEGDGFLLMGHASFAVIFGVGWVAHAAHHSDDEKYRLIGKEVLDPDLALKIQKTVEQLGWDLSAMSSPELAEAANEIFNYEP